MQNNFGLVYEVTHTLDCDIAADFDLWIAEHVEAMLSISGISRATTFVADDAEDGRCRRVSQYFFDSDEDLENYLAGPAAAMQSSATQQFGERFSVSRRLLHQSSQFNTSDAAQLCRNCGTTLSGQYCGNCGQRAVSRLISIWELVRDAFGDLFELDSRIWRTLIPLIAKPGRLTRDYLEGRRARFMPPFRTYLVLSIIFFLIAFFDPVREFGILLGTPPENDSVSAEEVAIPQEMRDEGLSDLVEDDVISAGTADESVSRSADSEQRTSAAVGEDEPNAELEDQQNDGFNFQIGDNESGDEDSCEDLESENWPDWLTRRLSVERMKIACERVTADDGQAFVGKLLDNVPAALIALLPIMAIVLKILYPLSKRYYVEHVLFVVHFHAFVFLILGLQVLFSRLIRAFGLPEVISIVTSVAVSLYIPIYLFKAIRHVYGQSWAVTLLKFFILLLAYASGLMGILIITAVFAAFSI